MFAFFGASRERSAHRLAQIAAWPSVSAPLYTDIDNHWLNASLNHVAAVMQVPRVLVLWEFAQEPYMFTALFADGRYQQYRATSNLFDDAVAPELEDATFASVAITKGCFTADGAKFPEGPAIGPSIQTQYVISSVCSAPFASDFCKGRVFMLDRPDWGDDDLALAEVVASRLRIELENYALCLRLNEAAASQERVRLARDLHDGTLQSLAAAGLQLKMIASHSEEKVHRTVENVRNLVLGEQKRIREFITGRPPTHPQKPTSLYGQMSGEVLALKRQWDCGISLSVIPTDAMVLPETSRQIEFIVAEATANAVRHGNSSQINIAVEQTPASIRLQVTDNGTGLEGVSDPLNQTELAARGIGPQSISKRVNDLRGTLSLSSSPNGVRLAIELPCPALPSRWIHGDANALG
jgi:signal transduction histidine kinase